MLHLAQILKENRQNKRLKLKEVSRALGIDVAILSKLERGERIATKSQVLSFIDFYSLNKKEIIVLWLSEKILVDYQDEDYAFEALRVAEETVKSNLLKASDFSLDGEVEILLSRIDELKAKWEDLKPLNTIQLFKMKEYFSLQYTYESNKIEGNTLTLQETHLVISDGLTISGKSMNEHLEAVNHAEAIEFISDLATRKETLTERTVKEIHYLILKGIDRRNAGVYRSVPVLISGSSHKPPQPYLLDKKMEEVFEFYQENEGKIHPVILAAEMHQRIVTVHPFIDGNGRTSRLIMNLILLMSGFTIANIKGELQSRQAYYQALEQVQVNDNVKDFHVLVCNHVIESLQEHIDLSV